MSKYSVRESENYPETNRSLRGLQDTVLVTETGVSKDESELYLMADLLNAETAPLIATIEAQNELIAKLLEYRNRLEASLRVSEAEKARYKAAMNEAIEALSNQTHGGAQYQPDVLHADSILRRGLSLIDWDYELTPQDIANIEKLAQEYDDSVAPDALPASEESEEVGE